MKNQFCTNCGEPLGENAQFCTSCGAKVGAETRQKKSGGAAKVPWLFFVGGALLVIAGIWWGMSSRTEALPTAAVAMAQPTEESTIPYPTIPRVTVGEVKTALDAGTAIVVDVRGLTYYQNAHITGAISLPTDDLELDYQTLPLDKTIYLYCT